MNKPKLNLDSIAAIAVLATGLMITGAWGVSAHGESASSSLPGTQLVLTPDGRMKLTVTAERAPEPRAERPALVPVTVSTTGTRS